MNQATPQSSDDSNNKNKLIRGQVRHNQLSARIPDAVSRGVFSTGAIVLMGNTEFILDFVLRMQRPHHVVQRVVLPHAVLPQLISTLEKNLEKYEARFGTLPIMPQPIEEQKKGVPPKAPKAPKAPESPEVSNLYKGSNFDEQTSAFDSQNDDANGPAKPENASPSSAAGSGDSGGVPLQSEQNADESQDPSEDTQSQNDSDTFDGMSKPTPAQAQIPVKPEIVNHPSIEDIYDDLKMPEDGLTAAYANAVMVSHSAAEFNLDFICNFFPRSMVTSRVFISAPQVVRMLDAVKNTYDEFQKRVIANRKQQIQQLNQQHDMPDYDPKSPYYKPPEKDDENQDDPDKDQ